MSDMTLTKLLRDNGLADRTTVHGFRSAFRDWAAERTNAPNAVMELALSQTVGSAVEQAYARSDLLEKRRVLMDQWARAARAPQVFAGLCHAGEIIRIRRVVGSRWS